MDVHHDYLAGDLLQEIVHLAKRIIRVVHEDASLQIDNGIAVPGPGSAFIQPYPGDSVRIVRRTQNPPRAGIGISVSRLEILDDFPLVPDMIAGGEHVTSKLKKFVGKSWRQTEAPSGILRIGNDQVN